MVLVEAVEFNWRVDLYPQQNSESRVGFSEQAEGLFGLQGRPWNQSREPSPSLLQTVRTEVTVEAF